MTGVPTVMRVVPAVASCDELDRQIDLDVGRRRRASVSIVRPQSPTIGIGTGMSEPRLDARAHA